MKYKIKTHEAFKIIGIAVRTNNNYGKSQEDIGNLWKRVFAEGILDQIPNKVTSEIVCLYTNYESDYTENYTTILGCKVDTLDDIPHGMYGMEIEEALYVMARPKGRLPDIVGNTWSEIHKSDLPRTYIADFDIYGEEARDPKNASVEIWVGVREE